jgi:LacI family transcriptional regulator, gluconate utilization system Gnt-I transcriptional repressor
MNAPDLRSLSVTLADVARLAGVSAMTVSRVVNTPDRVPPATVKRVQAAATKLGYVRNRMAGGLRSNKSHLVAAIVPALSSPVFSDTIEALTQGLASHGYHLIVGQTGYAEPREDEILRDIISRRPDAIVLTGTMHSKEARRLLLSAGVPVLETWDLTDSPIDMLIGFSHEAVGGAVSQHLYERGRRRLALVGADDMRSRRRWRAYERRAREMGLKDPIAHFVPAPAKLGDGRRALNALLAESNDIDGIFCSSDMLAAGVLLEANALGVTVPSMLSVVGFGDLNFARDLNPSLTSVRVEASRIGHLAAETIVKRLHAAEVPDRIVDVGFSIIQRHSS